MDSQRVVDTEIKDITLTHLGIQDVLPFGGPSQIFSTS